MADKRGEAFDAVVIGAGAGGGAVAWGLARRGVRVLVLDAGPSYDPVRDYRVAQTHWEQSRFPELPGSSVRYTFGPPQALDRRWSALRSWSHISGSMASASVRRQGWYHHVRGVGGTTLHFTAEAHRLHPASMKLRSRFGVGADWPVSYEELEPFYCTAEEIVGVAGPSDPGARVRSRPYPLRAHTPSYASTKLGVGCRKLGLRWVPAPVAALSAPHDGRPACNYCANCARGCPIGDKGSVDVTFIRRALAVRTCTVAARCQVVHLEAGADDLVAAVHYVDASGARHRIRPRIVVLAAGAVETPRLLLASKNRYAPDGLANESGHVGRNFMETLAWTSSGLHPERIDSFRGLPSDSVCWDFNAPDAIANVVGGCRLSPATAEADLLGPINYARRVVPGWGREHKREMRRWFGHVLAIKSVGESLPGPRSYVDLDPAERDEFGIQVARIHSHLEAMELRRLEFMARTARNILHAAGVDRIFEEYGTYDMFNSTQVFGTARMGSDPRDSVVDRWCRSHRWRNLYITDASVFPSSGGGEAPSLTIQALALRAAEAIRKSSES